MSDPPPDGDDPSDRTEETGAGVQKAPAEQPTGGDDGLRRQVEPCEDGAHVRVPRDWLGATVTVTRAGRESAGGRGADGPVIEAPDVDGYGHVAGGRVRDQLRAAAAAPRTTYVGYASHDAGVRHVGVPRAALDDGVVVTGAPGVGKSSLLGSLAWQAAVGGAGVAVVGRDPTTGARFARALPDDRFEDLVVVGGPERWSVSMLDAGVDRSSPDFFAAIDAATDGLVSMLDVLSPQLRDAIREYVMVAQGPNVTPSLTHVADLVRSGYEDGAGGPEWAHEASPDLSNRVAGVGDLAIDRFLESLEPLLDESVRAFLDDPDPDRSLAAAVTENRPVVVSLPPGACDADTWPWVARAVTHKLWAATRELLPEGADDPFYLLGDDFGPALDVGPDVGRLLGRVRGTQLTFAAAIDGPDAVADATWEGLADTGAAALFSPGEADVERVTAGRGVDADDLADLGPHEFWFDGGETPRRATVYPPLPPRRDVDELSWL